MKRLVFAQPIREEMGAPNSPNDAVQPEIRRDTLFSERFLSINKINRRTTMANQPYQAKELSMADTVETELDRHLNRRGRRAIERTNGISIEVRLHHGLISIEECASLAGFSEQKIRLDEKRGLISFVKIGGCTRIRGPDARRYLDCGDAGAA